MSEKKDNFAGFNIAKKKPFKTRARTIYLAVDNLMIQGDEFLPTWDTTDHFHFVCAGCHCVANVYEIIFVPKYSGQVGASLHFFLSCPECEKSGQRKIYLKMRSASCKFQQTFTHDGKVLQYGKERTPYAEIQYVPEKRKRKKTKLAR